LLVVALLALIPIISGLIGGASITSIFAALSLTQWIGIASALVNAEPAVVVAVRELHPIFDALIESASTIGPTQAGTAAWRSRQPQFIEGYLPDGSLGQVPNPDYLAGENASENAK
jgi:hypothetical protein